MLGADLRGLARRSWSSGAAGLGVALTAVAAAVAATHEGAARADSFRAGAATILLLLGLVVALALGATAFNRDGDSGALGLLVGAGLTRGDLTLARLGARLAVLLGVVAVWGLAFQVGSLAIGRGLDGPLAVHTLSMIENLILVMAASAMVSTVLGPTVAAIVGLSVFVIAQAVVNLKAAADQTLIGSVARPAVGAAYYVLPRAVNSPMIVDLQSRGQGSAAAPRLEINGALARVPAAGWDTVLWTLLWCALFAGACVAGMRRRTL